MLVSSQKRKGKGLAVAPIGLRYHAKETGALAHFSKPKWASGEILVHVIHAKQMKLKCTDIFLICACHPEYE